MADLGTWMDEVTQRVRENGYAALPSIGIPGYAAISAPVWDADSELVYVLSLTGPATMVDFDRAGAHVPLLLAEARDLSRLMGAPSSLWRDAPK